MSANSGPLSDLESLDSDERVGTVLADRYRLDALLGEGGMGRVYQAEHVLMRKRVAVKILHAELTRVPEVVARFEREAMAAANIEHPNVAAATDFGKLDDGSVFLVLEFVQGKNLRDEIAEGPIPPARAAHITRQIAAALEAAHALGIVHRDLKPENVMLIDKAGDQDFVKVLDFGVAKVPIGEPTKAKSSHGNPITKAGMVFGTPEYMAPEQALGQPVDGRADLYALGVIFYEMLSGQRPFSSKSTVGILGQQLSKPPPRLQERCPGIVVPPSIEGIVLKLLAKEPHERFANAGDVVTALSSLLGPMPTRLRTVSSPALEVVEPRLVSIPDLEPPNETPLETLPVSGMPLSEASLSAPQPSLPESSVATAQAGLARLHAWLDARRSTLPPALASALKPVPTPALLWGTLAAVAFGALALGAIVISLATSSGSDGPGKQRVSAPDATQTATGGESSPSPSAGEVAPELAGSADPPEAPEAAPTAPSSGLEAELASAKQKGSTGLLALEKTHGEDARISAELAMAYVAERKYVDAVAAAGRALKQDPNINRDRRVKNALFAAAQMPVSADAAFRMLDQSLADRAGDVFFSLVMTKKVLAPTRARAERWLEKNHADPKKATRAVSVAYQLFSAKNCPDRHGLLEAAGRDGDTRALLLLKELEKTTGCAPGGNGDCHPCLRGDDGLARAIAAIEERYPRR